MMPDLSSFQHTFLLKQHTPMIHFQHRQNGATLRGTELKPKLDRYIIEQETGILEDYEKAKEAFAEKHKNWCVGKRKRKGVHVALDYRVRVKVLETVSTKDKQYLSNKFEEIKKRNGEPSPKTDRNRQTKTDEFEAIIWNRKSFPGFFGNMDKETLRKELVLHKKLEVQFLVFEQGLKTLIVKYFPAFLQKTNFGTRQSKGFGSFGLHPEDAHYEQFLNFPSPYRFFVDVEKAFHIYEELEWLFDTIDLVYRCLRSGINLKDRDQRDVFYFKSLMFQYAKSKNPPLQWDKKTIRQALYREDSTYKKAERKRTDTNGTFRFAAQGEKYLFRDLLGLSSEQEWRNYRNSTVKKAEILPNNKKAEISRFRSPITFKPLKMEEKERYKIFVMWEQIPQRYKQATFEISNGKKNKNLPVYPKFDLSDFLRFCFREVFVTKGKFDEKKFDVYTDYSEERQANYLYTAFEDLSQNPEND